MPPIHSIVEVLVAVVVVAMVVAVTLLTMAARGQKNTRNKSKNIFFDRAQIGSKLDRGLGRPLHTDSHTNGRWGPLGAERQDVRVSHQPEMFLDVVIL